MERRKYSFIAYLIILYTCEISSRATSDQTSDEVQEEQKIQLHVLTKREVDDLQQDYPRVEGRTFRASEPLDPNGSDTVNGDLTQNIFPSFDAQNEIFQPEVESGSSLQRNEIPAGSADVQHNGNIEGNVTESDNETRTSYGAQYPYSETTVSENEYRGPLPQTRTSSNGYQTSDGLRHSVTSQRVVLAGRGPDNSERSRGYSTSRGSDQYQPSRSGYTSHSGDSSSRQVSTGRRVYSGYNTGNTGTSRYQNSRTEVRGPYYGGPRYVDSNGHYVDAQGRHLDSTGRYYDISGRYADATMTGSHVYRHTGGTGTYNTGSSSGYYDSRGRYISGTDSRGGYYDSSGRYIPGSSGSSVSYDRSGGSYVDTSRSRPVDSYGGTQFYSSGRSYQTTYDPVVSQISSDPNCAVMNTHVTINGLTCDNAITQLGSYVCYNYERVSTECCERCLQVKRSENVGCEYGDRSSQCRDIQPLDCYNDRNRQICCDRCRQFREQRAGTSSDGCEYGDMTPRCQTMMQRPNLCYLPDNQRICCHSCPRLANVREPDCQWGNQNPEFCQPFDTNRRLQVNCYERAVQEICCSTCRSLRERMPENIPGCEYGDSPMLFYNGREALECSGYISQYGLENCNDPEVARNCCYTCYRYRSRA